MYILFGLQMYGLENIKAEVACSPPLNAVALLVTCPGVMGSLRYVNVSN